MLKGSTVIVLVHSDGSRVVRNIVVLVVWVLRKGGAIISNKHCNFIINENNATATDIETLGEIVRKKVFEKTGKKLKWEIKIVGEK